MAFLRKGDRCKTWSWGGLSICDGRGFVLWVSSGDGDDAGEAMEMTGCGSPCQRSGVWKIRWPLRLQSFTKSQRPQRCGKGGKEHCMVCCTGGAVIVQVAWGFGVLASAR